jgi:hypothetical protein
MSASLTAPFLLLPALQLDRPIRTKCLKDALSKVRVPEAAYLPLCKSTDPWLRILRIIPEEARAFSTKARCPCLCLFEVERDQVRHRHTITKDRRSSGSMEQQLQALKAKREVE